MNRESLPPKWFMLIFVISLLFRLLPVLFYPEMQPSPDAIQEYDPIATNILAGKGFVNAGGFPDCDRGPGYPLFLAVIYTVFTRDFLLVRVIQGIIDSGTVIIAMLFAERLFAIRNVTVLAGLLTACYPLLIYSSNLVAVETLFLFVFMMTLYLFISAHRSENLFLYSLSGITLASSALIRSTTLLFPVLIGFWMFAVSGFTRKNLSRYVLFLVSFIITISPWTIRNYLVFHEVIPTTINGGLNFYVGSSLRYLTSAEKRLVVTKEDYRKMFSRENSTISTLSPKSRDASYWQAAWLNYREAWNRSPSDIMELMLLKTGRFWYATDSGRNEKLLSCMQLPFAVLALAGFIRALKCKGYSKEIWLLAMSVGYFWGLFAVMFPLARYTIPVLPIMAIFTALLFTSGAKAESFRARN